MSELDLIRQQVTLQIIHGHMLLLNIGFLEALYMVANPINIKLPPTRHVMCRNKIVIRKHL